MVSQKRGSPWAVTVGVVLAFAAGTVFGKAASQPASQSQAKARMAAPPPQYAALRNPYSVSDKKILAEGEKIYNKNCWLCHGALGDGMGPGTPDLVPRPADFTNRERVARMSDGYWFWRVKEGFPEDLTRLMPAWKQRLTDDEIWKVITYAKTFAMKGRG